LEIDLHPAGDGFIVSRPGLPGSIHFRSFQGVYVANLGDTHVSPKAIDMAEDIYGKDVAVLKGKATQAKPVVVDPFLLSITTTLGYTMASQLVGSKPQSAESLLHDPQSSLLACQEAIKSIGVQVDDNGPAQQACTL